MTKKDDFQSVYDKLKKNLSKEQNSMCLNVFKRVVENITSFILRHVEIHKKVLLCDESYSKFIKNVFSEEDYDKLLKLGQSQKKANIVNGVKSFGLFPLTKKAFGFGNRAVKKKFIQYLKNAEDVIKSYNISKEIGENFSLYLLTCLTLKDISLEDVFENIKDMDF